MSKIPGWAYMLVGVAVSAYSKFVETQRETNLSLFFWVGIIMLLYGIFREVNHRLSNKKAPQEKTGPPEKPPEQQLDHRHPAGNKHHGHSPHEQHPHTRPQQHPSHPHQPTQKRCPDCHSVSAYRARFCHNCSHSFYES